MKKVYILLGCTLLPIVSYANIDKNKGYISLDLGWSIAKDFKSNTNNSMQIGKKSKGGAGVIGTTIGFYPSDNTKLDLSIQHVFNMKYGKTAKGTTFMNHRNIYNTNYKLYSAFLSGYYLFKNDLISPFIGVGLGYTKIKGSYNLHSSIANSNQQFFIATKSIANITNPSYRLTLGIQMNTGDKSKIDISYNYTDYGKVYFYDLATHKKHSIGKLKGHSIMISPRMEF